MMRCRRILLAIVMICLSLFQLACISTPPPLPSHNTLVKSEPLTFDAFMASYLSLLPISEGGLYGTFDGELIQIPQELQKELVKYFPDYIFEIARVKNITWEVPKANLLVILDVNTKTVQSYFWVDWLIDSPGLTFLFRSRNWPNLDEIQAGALTLAKLAVLLSGREVGEVNLLQQEPAPEDRVLYEGTIIIEIDLKPKFSQPDRWMILTLHRSNDDYSPEKVEFTSVLRNRNTP